MGEQGGRGREQGDLNSNPSNSAHENRVCCDNIRDRVRKVSWTRVSTTVNSPGNEGHRQGRS